MVNLLKTAKLFSCNAEVVEKDHYTEEKNASTQHAMNTQSSASGFSDWF